MFTVISDLLIDGGLKVLYYLIFDELFRVRTSV